jgi:hypothetical protein
MSKFNMSKSEQVVSYEGGEAYSRNPLKNWLNQVMSWNVEDGFYQDKESKMLNYIGLTNSIINTYGAEFAAKTAIFSRNEIGMRSITHLTAAILNSYSFDGKRSFYRQVCKRPDDVAEIFAAIDMLGDRKSHALIRGCGDYLSQLDEYHIAKYKMNNKKYNMYDIINLTHAHSFAIQKYKKNILPPAETWENIISNSEGDKSQNWIELLKKGQLGYLALLRNINNIMRALDELENNGQSYEDSKAIINDYLVPQLTNAAAIRKSLVFPLQIYIARKNLCVENIDIINALNLAFQISTKNIPSTLGKETTIIMDVSGSMSQSYSANSSVSAAEVSAVYATALFIRNGSPVIKFGNIARLCNDYSRHETAFALIEKMMQNDNLGYGTEIDSAVPLIGDDCTRILLFSDMQVCKNDNQYAGYYWMPMYMRQRATTISFNDWVKNHNLQVHSFDLGSYPSQCVSDDSHFHFVTSLSDKIFNIILLSEQDEDFLYNYINNL